MAKDHILELGNVLHRIRFVFVSNLSRLKTPCTWTRPV